MQSLKPGPPTPLYVLRGLTHVPMSQQAKWFNHIHYGFPELPMTLRSLWLSSQPAFPTWHWEPGVPSTEIPLILRVELLLQMSPVLT
jgi:hypothetical protein